MDRHNDLLAELAVLHTEWLEQQRNRIVSIEFQQHFALKMASILEKYNISALSANLFSQPEFEKKMKPKIVSSKQLLEVLRDITGDEDKKIENQIANLSSFLQLMEPMPQPEEQAAEKQEQSVGISNPVLQKDTIARLQTELRQEQAKNAATIRQLTSDLREKEQENLILHGKLLKNQREQEAKYRLAITTGQEYRTARIEANKQWEQLKKKWESDLASANARIEALTNGMPAVSSQQMNVADKQESEQIQKLKEELEKTTKDNKFLRMCILSDYPNEVKIYNFPTHLLQRPSLQFDEIRQLIDYWISVHKFLGPGVAADLVKVRPEFEYWLPENPRAKNVFADHQATIFLTFRSKEVAAYFSRIVNNSSETIVMFDEVYNFRPWAELVESKW